MHKLVRRQWGEWNHEYNLLVNKAHKRNTCCISCMMDMECNWVESNHIVVIGKMRLGSLEFGSLEMGSLKMGSLKTGSLKMGSLKMGRIELGNRLERKMELGNLLICSRTMGCLKAGTMVHKKLFHYRKIMLRTDEVESTRYIDMCNLHLKFLRVHKVEFGSQLE